MVRFTTTIKKFDAQGEKTGWSYIGIPADIAAKIKKGEKKSYRVKGRLDDYKITGVSLLPMGGGAFIIPLNAAIRKGTGKRVGAMLKVELEEDKAAFRFNKDFMECLADEPTAAVFFKSLTGSHQRYFSKWIDSAKTDATKARRIAQAVTALSGKMGYAEMIRSRNADQ